MVLRGKVLDLFEETRKPGFPGPHPTSSHRNRNGSKGSEGSRKGQLWQLSAVTLTGRRWRGRGGRQPQGTKVRRFSTQDSQPLVANSSGSLAG